jgi:WD40 repeat protein/serine/threonine protein kinase
VLRADQRRRWQRGEQYLVEAYLRQHPALCKDTEAVLDLIYNEVILREEQGAKSPLEEYQKRFPDLAAQLKDLFDVHQALESAEPGDSTLQGDLPILEDKSGSPNVTLPGETLTPLIAGPQPAAGGVPEVPGYQILARVGSGTFGVVYKARHLRLKRVVALKMMREGMQDHPDEVARFRAEAEMVARLQHPNIVQIHEIGDYRGLPFLALEFVDGGSLAQKLDGTPLPGRVAADLIQTLARAMHAAHQHGIVHRDLKPGNILLAPNPKPETRNPKSEIRNPKQVVKTEKDNAKTEPIPIPELKEPGAALGSDCGLRIAEFSPKVTDFGLAKRLDTDSSRTRSGTILGTPSYMAPEQAAGKVSTVGPAADTYALGAILYELLTGRPPFRAETALDTVLLVLSEEPVAPRRLSPGASRDLETICLKCLQKDPRKRYASALDLAEDLRRFLGGEPITARPVSLGERLWKWAKRRPAVASLVAVSALALLVLVIGSLVYNAQLSQALEATRERELTARQNLYIADLNLAQGEWNDAHVGRVRDLLAGQVRPGPNGQDLRGFEWYYLDHLCRSIGEPLAGREGVAYSPDGKYLATGRGANVVIYDLSTRRPVHILKGYPAQVQCVAFSPDGKFVGAGGLDGKVCVWEASSGRLRFTGTAHQGRVESLAFSPTGKALASAGPTGEIRPGKRRRPVRIIQIWAVPGGQRLFEIRTDLEEVILGLAFSPDGKRIASASYDGFVKLWAADSPHRDPLVKRLLYQPLSFVGLAFYQEGKYARVAAASWDRSVHVWNPVRGNEFLILTGHSGTVAAVAAGPDGKRLATASWDRTVCIWDADTKTSGPQKVRGPLFILRGHLGSVVGVAFRPDGQQVASVGSDGQVHLWDPTRPQEFRIFSNPRPPHTGMGLCAAFSPDGRHLVSGGQDRQATVWDVRTGKIFCTFGGHRQPITCVAYAPDGRRIASAADDGMLQVWDPRTGRVVQTLTGHSGPVAGVVFSPDGRRLASAANDKGAPTGEFRIWDAGTGKELYRWRRPYKVAGVAFNPAGDLLATAEADGAIRLWNVTTFNEVRKLTGHLGVVNAVAFSPDGRRLASAGADGKVIVWDVADGRRFQELLGHSGRVLGVAFSPDGRRLASAGENPPLRGAIKVWDAVTGKETLTLYGHASLIGSRGSVVFSPDGRRLASAGGLLHRGEVRIWDGE